MRSIMIRMRFRPHMGTTQRGVPSGTVKYLVTMAAILFSRSFLSAFSSNKLNTSSRVMGPVKGFPSAPSAPIEPLEERRLSRLFRRSWP